MSRYEVEVREDKIILRKESENGLLAWHKFAIYMSLIGTVNILGFFLILFT